MKTMLCLLINQRLESENFPMVTCIFEVSAKLLIVIKGKIWKLDRGEGEEHNCTFTTITGGIWISLETI